MMELDSFLSSIPFYRVLDVQTVCPSCSGTAASLAWGLILTLTPAILYLLKCRKLPVSFSKVVVGSFPATILFFARVVLSIACLFSGSVWLSYIATLNLIVLPIDAICFKTLFTKQRRGLALLSLFNIPLLPPYLMPSIGLVVTYLPIMKMKVPKGIVLGVASHVATYTPIYLLDRSSDIRTAHRDWVIRKYGPAPVTWNPASEGNPHLLVAGASGMGKSTLMYYLIVKLISKGYPVTVLDPLGQYAVLAKVLEEAIRSRNYEKISEMFLTKFPEEAPSKWNGVRIYSIIERGMDVFKPVAGEPAVQVAEDLSYSISIVERQSLGATQHDEIIKRVSETMRATVRRLTRKTAEAERPSLWDLVRRIEQAAEEFYQKRRLRTYEAIMNLAVRIKLLARYLEPKEEPIEPKLLEAKRGENGKWGELVVVDLSGILDDDVKAIAMELLLRKLRRYISTKPLAPPDKPWFIIVDEAWILMRHASEYKSVVNEMIREVRNRGVGLLLLTQRLRDLSRDALANIGTKIYLRLGEGGDVTDIVEYTGCHLLREVMSQLAPHQGIILKRVSTLDRISEATMYTSSADVLLFAKLAHLYPDKELWHKAEQELNERKNRALERLEVEAQEVEVEVSETNDSANVAVVKKVGREDSTSLTHGRMEQNVEQPTSRRAVASRGGFAKEVETFFDIISAALKMCGEEGKRILNMLDKDQVAILFAHLSIRPKNLSRSDPLTKTLHDLKLTSVENNFIVPKKSLIVIKKTITGNRQLRNTAKAIARNSCPECLTFLQVDGTCPSCGRRWRK